ncbi:hypothetical protein [Paracoccus laeviglucosivorans]|uniref:Uncharacterized protein n=1 Tax=Paracoccus laeviglucosivorans TaxID=1197861 RepID=A0A521AZZ0_9RHOB|nr:hypothetical protein [Paracoccus laeviglucosivorans]SMO40355.1 hypothetical protein SAMN06265221_10217 [Paracoccus laeviglucosivorans]
MSILLSILAVLTILAIGVLSLIWLLENGPVRGWSALRMISADITVSLGGAMFAVYLIGG